mmetsp:Transcript_38691/g.111071  ORF Transcript_38691/g.111071 Transcript_38691/m.111071 type:complete len:200 (-) Transcript_38691:1067-1666(-)
MLGDGAPPRLQRAVAARALQFVAPGLGPEALLVAVVLEVRAALHSTGRRDEVLANVALQLSQPRQQELEKHQTILHLLDLGPDLPLAELLRGPTVDGKSCGQRRAQDDAKRPQQRQRRGGLVGDQGGGQGLDLQLRTVNPQHDCRRLGHTNRPLAIRGALLLLIAGQGVVLHLLAGLQPLPEKVRGDVRLPAVPRELAT